MTASAHAHATGEANAHLERTVSHAVACFDACVTDVELQLVGGPQREAGGMHRRAQAEARMRDLSATFPEDLSPLFQRTDPQARNLGSGRAAGRREDRQVPCQTRMASYHKAREKGRDMSGPAAICGPWASLKDVHGDQSLRLNAGGAWFPPAGARWVR